MAFSMMKMKSDKIINTYDKLAGQEQIKNPFLTYARIKGFKSALFLNTTFDYPPPDYNVKETFNSPHRSALAKEAKNWKKNKGVELSDTFDSPNGKELLISTRVTDFPSFEISGVKYSVAQVNKSFVFIQDDKIISHAPTPTEIGSRTAYNLEKGIIHEDNLFLISAVHVPHDGDWAGMNYSMIKVDLTAGNFDFRHLTAFRFQRGVDRIVKISASELELHRIPDSGKPFKRVFNPQTEYFGEPISSKENVFGRAFKAYYSK